MFPNLAIAWRAYLATPPCTVRPDTAVSILLCDSIPCKNNRMLQVTRNSWVDLLLLLINLESCYDNYFSLGLLQLWNKQNGMDPETANCEGLVLKMFRNSAERDGQNISKGTINLKLFGKDREKSMNILYNELLNIWTCIDHADDLTWDIPTQFTHHSVPVFRPQNLRRLRNPGSQLRGVFVCRQSDKKRVDEESDLRILYYVHYFHRVWQLHRSSHKL